MIFVTKFRANDLNPSKGKQIEFNKGVVESIFGFTKSEEDATFVCCSLAAPSVKSTIKVHFTLSPARGDYKVYQNADGTPDLKDYFLDTLHLTPANINDYFAIKRTGPSKYALFYIPSGHAASSFFTLMSADPILYMPGGEDSGSGDDSDEEKDKGTIQKILYGCPGTGKSFEVKKRTEDLDSKKAVYFDKDGKRIDYPEDETERIKTPSNIFRTTFHPDYDYATFVGTYKPLMKRPKGKEDDETVKEELSYDFVPQVFTKAYVRAWKSWEDASLEGKDKNVFLIIEEINRGNCAQIFGDLFQLLDRKDGFSEFPIIPDAELGKYLKDKEVPYDSLRLPPNFHIYATMNTSDQSLFPMDSAFKRRWSMEYVPIKYEGTDAAAYKLNLYKTEFDWTKFLRLVNAKILDATNSEDKQMGEFFIKQKEITEVEFINKVMFYLWNDVCKDLFNASRMSKNYFLRDTKDTFFTFAELYSGRHRKNQPDKGPKDLLIGFMQYLESEAEDNLNDQANEQGSDPMNEEQ